MKIEKPFSFLRYRLNTPVRMGTVATFLEQNPGEHRYRPSNRSDCLILYRRTVNLGSYRLPARWDGMKARRARIPASALHFSYQEAGYRLSKLPLSGCIWYRNTFIYIRIPSCVMYIKLSSTKATLLFCDDVP
ncbi:hypothetical protein M407DRAFT_142201 [Tulasnella calospora MUT 4182]|uniref:Uncharacterized protein n=1 Tax=Tulasnella calospora MUT 4182 TaxID=1051891 RepID=A0A0C3KEX5_9AGAM|nr:hypothetical protein M407DRAFT_142201 [Tulasnella calospora MUT 4182]